MKVWKIKIYKVLSNKWAYTITHPDGKEESKESKENSGKRLVKILSEQLQVSPVMDYGDKINIKLYGAVWGYNDETVVEDKTINV